MDSRINLLHLVNGFAIGGAERKLLDLVRNLDKGRYNITVCSVGQDGPLRRQFENCGVDVQVFPKHFSFDLSLVFRVAWLMKVRRIQVVQTTLLYADLIGALAARWAGVPVIISWETVSHGPEDVLRTKWRHRMTYRWLMHYVTKIVAVSEQVKRSIIRYGRVVPEKVVTIHYGVNLEKFALRPGEDLNQRREKLGFPTTGVLFGVVARLEKWKGYTYLLPAAYHLIDEFPQAKFVFVGDGSLRQQIVEEIRQRGLENHFLLLGFRDDVQEILPALDVFVLPSLTEGLPNAVLEAMACSKPVIATAVGGVREVVEDGITGFLVPPRDSEALYQAMRRLLLDVQLAQQMGREGRRRVEEFFSLEKEVQSFQRLYEDQLNEVRKLS